ncbi:TolC family protein [Pelagibacteraceae bacterium]|nr:TolC family protein [Pelagibacteraceae bacterium]|tara:strand:+ start:704 stop:1993 length:1290 start_codon:yes stop_codon:yes gene_type:complete
MKYIIIVIILSLKSSFLYGEDNLLYFIDSAFKNNPKLNAERNNFKAMKENINISRSEFLPSLTVSGSQTSTETFNRTNQSGQNLSDTNTNTETKSFSVDQKIFQGFQGYNSLKKSQLELEKAKFQLQLIEQETILNSVTAFYDLVFKNKSKNFNISNVDLFERQVESDSVRLQKGEITLTDLAQSESSLAGARAKLIAAETNFLTSKTYFERITRAIVPENLESKYELNIKLPTNLNEALKLSKTNNPNLMVAKMESLVAEKELNIEKAKFAPKASLNYTKSENNDFSTSVDENDQETVKATLSWPLIKGGKNYSSIKKSSYKNEESRLLLEDTKNEIISSTTNSWSSFQSSKSVLEATKAQLKAAEIANEGITLEYDSGNTRTTLEVIQSRTLLLDARISKAKAERDFVVAQFELLDMIGNLNLNIIK